MQTKKPNGNGSTLSAADQKAVFGTVVAKMSLSQKVECHIKKGADHGKAVNIAKFVNTTGYKGYSGGFQIPNEKWREFQKMVMSVKVA